MDAICKEGLRKKVFAPKGLLYHGEIKALETSFGLILSEKKLDSPQKQYTSFHKIPTIFSNLELGTRTKLKNTYYIWQL